MKFEAVLFDFDGVIANTMDYHVEAWKQAFSKYNLELTANDIFFQEGQVANEIAGNLTKARGIFLNDKEIDLITRRKRDIYNKITKARIYPETKEFVSRLKKMYIKMGIVTGSIIRNMVIVTGEEFLKNFDCIVTADSVQNNKPHPEPYMTGAQKLNVKPEACVVIENAPLGIKAAKAAGMFCIALKTTIKDEQFLCNADIIIDNLKLFPFTQFHEYFT